MYRTSYRRFSVTSILSILLLCFLLRFSQLYAWRLNSASEILTPTLSRTRGAVEVNHTQNVDITVRDGGLPWKRPGNPHNSAIVILVTNEAYLQQLNESLPLLQKNWLKRIPVRKLVVFYTNEICLSSLVAITSVCEDTLVVHEQLEVNHPHFLAHLPEAHCKCCCNNRTERKRDDGSIGGEYNIGYCFMNRFRTLIMYRLPVLRDVDYFVQVDTDLKVEKPMPYNPVTKLTTKRAVFGFKQLIVRDQDCAAGMDDAIGGFLKLNVLSPVFKPKAGSQYGGNFNIGDLRFFRSEQYYTFARYINNDVTGVYTSRWGDQAFLPHILGLYFTREELILFNDLHESGVLVHRSRSLGRRLRKNDMQKKCSDV